jgi:hypothetical protein
MAQETESSRLATSLKYQEHRASEVFLKSRAQRPRKDAHNCILEARNLLQSLGSIIAIPLRPRDRFLHVCFFVGEIDIRLSETEGQCFLLLLRAI